MTTMQIECPQCHAHIEIDKVLERQVLERHTKLFDEKAQKAREDLEAKQEKFRLEKEEAREEYAAKRKADRIAMKKELKLELEKESTLKIEFLTKQIEAHEKKLSESQQSELALIHQKKELEDAKRVMELSIEKRVQTELESIRERMAEESAQAAKIAKEELIAKSEALRRQQEMELTLRREKAELIAKMENQEIQIARQIGEERAKIRCEVIKQSEETHRFQLSDKEKTISEMKKVIEELNAKAVESSQQKKGEVAELEVEKQLNMQYPMDVIEPVLKGVQGADIKMYVKNKYNQPCGTIIIEAKRTKTWNNAWIQKLQQDKQDAMAHIAVLVTSTMPSGKEKFYYQDGIWITDFETLYELISVLRIHLIELSRLTRVNENKVGKMNEIYKYVSGVEFSMKVNAILEHAQRMRDDLASEKSTLIKIWSRREKQIDAIAGTTNIMVGEVEGLLGTAMTAAQLKEDADKKAPLSA